MTGEDERRPRADQDEAGDAGIGVTSVLVMLALYAWTVWIDVPIAPLMSGFGVAVALAMAWMGWRFRRLLRQRMQREPESASRPAESRKGVV